LWRRRPKKIAELGDLTFTGCWRVVGRNEQLNPKFLGGKVVQARRLVEEGHKMEDGRVVTGKRRRKSL